MLNVPGLVLGVLLASGTMLGGWYVAFDAGMVRSNPASALASVGGAFAYYDDEEEDIDVDVFLLVVVIRECTSHARECGSGIAAHHSRIESDIPSAKHSAGSEQHPKHKSGYVEHYPNPTSYMRGGKPPVWMTPPEEGARRGRMSATADMRRVMPARARAGATHSPLYCGSSSTRYIWQVPSRNDKTHKSDLWVLFPKDDVFIPPRPKCTLCSTTCVLRPRKRPRGRRARTQDSRRPAMTPISCQRRSSRRY